MALSSASTNNIKSTLNAACDDADKGIPGVVAVAIGKDGKELFAHAAGKRGFGSDEPMTLENIFWIASCTKMITGVACMQLVEQGKLSLDDAGQIATLCPEIKNPNVLQPDGKLVRAKTGITLRMLLSHTGQTTTFLSPQKTDANAAGFGYTFFNTALRDHSKPIGYDEFSGHIQDLIQPLVHQPGEGWEYGVRVLAQSIDSADTE